MRLSLLLALECLNVPYIWGGNNPLTGLDCSGFFQWILKKMGKLDENRDFTAQNIHDELVKSCAISVRPRADCALFFGNNLTEITHCALAVNEEWMIEAAHGSSHMVLPQQAVDKFARVEFNRINRRRDLVSCIWLNSDIIN